MSTGAAGAPAQTTDDEIGQAIDRILRQGLAPPDIVFGLVGAVGTGLNEVESALGDSLRRIGYELISVRISDILKDLGERLGHPVPESPREARYNALMDAGDALRRRWDDPAAAALLAISQVARLRRAGAPTTKRAFVVHSLKNPAEEEALRAVYGRSFLLIGAYAPEELRFRLLSRAIAQSHFEIQNKYEDQARKLIQRDQDDRTLAGGFGQNVRDTFPRSDVFIDTSDPAASRASLDRFVELVYGHPFHTPTREEYAMALARTAALRSADLGRQVGAAIASPEGDVIALGSNDAPKAGGGLYWTGDEPDGRDFHGEIDPSNEHKQAVVAEVLARLNKSGWLSAMDDAEFNRKRDILVNGGSDSPLKGTRLASLLEFGTSVHAEVTAIMDAARRGASTKGAWLYSTTFPCHECARHIVVAGIAKVFYIDPYPKSLAQVLQGHAISVEGAPSASSLVSFLPFTGVAPRLYPRVFTVGEDDRKSASGRVTRWSSEKARPRASLQGNAMLTLILEHQRRNRMLELSKLLDATESGAGPELAEAGVATPDPASK